MFEIYSIFLNPLVSIFGFRGILILFTCIDLFEGYVKM